MNPDCVTNESSYFTMCFKHKCSVYNVCNGDDSNKSDPFLLQSKRKNCQSQGSWLGVEFNQVNKTMQVYKTIYTPSAKALRLLCIRGASELWPLWQRDFIQNESRSLVKTSNFWEWKHFSEINPRFGSIVFSINSTTFLQFAVRVTTSILHFNKCWLFFFLQFGSSLCFWHETHICFCLFCKRKKED